MPPAKSPFCRSAQTVQRQPAVTLALLLSLIEHYQILLAGGVNEKRDGGSCGFNYKKKKKVHLSTRNWPGYELQFHCWRGCVPLQW